MSVQLLERWNCVAQVLRLLRDYFKQDIYWSHDLGPWLGSGVQPSVAVHTCVARHVLHHGAHHVLNIHNPITHIAVHTNHLKYTIYIWSDYLYLYVCALTYVVFLLERFIFICMKTYFCWYFLSYIVHKLLKADGQNKSVKYVSDK